MSKSDLKSNINYENTLIKIFPGKIKYETEIGTFYLLGDLPVDLGSMLVNIHFESELSQRKYRSKIDLYNNKLTQLFKEEILNIETISQTLLDQKFYELINLLEQYREDEIQNSIRKTRNFRKPILLTPILDKQSLSFLREPNLINRINLILEEIGLIGEKNNRILLYIIASSYKMENPLHCIIQGMSGSGKSYLTNLILSLLPQEDVLSLTRVTSKSFYYYHSEELHKKLIVLQDFDGLDDDAKFAFRELQSAGFISSSYTKKDKNGFLVSSINRLEASFASITTTTESNIYYDNLNRSIIIGMDESESQTNAIVDFQNKIHSGKFDTEKMVNKKLLLQNCLRLIKQYNVINRYAEKIVLPIETKQLRRLNLQFHQIIKQITLLNQFQREKDKLGNLYTTKEDVLIAYELFFDAIILKIDELDSSSRKFYELLKNYLKNIKKCKTFTSREIRHALHFSKSHISRFIIELKNLEYIQIESGSSNKGYLYRILFWDDIDKTKEKLKKEIELQLNQI